MQTFSDIRAMQIFMLILASLTIEAYKTNIPLQSPQQPLVANPPASRSQSPALYSTPTLYSSPPVHAIPPPTTTRPTTKPSQPTMYHPKSIPHCVPSPPVSIYVAPPQSRPPQATAYVAPLKQATYAASAPKQTYNSNPASATATTSQQKNQSPQQAAPKSKGAGQTTAQGTSDNKNSWFGDSSAALQTFPSAMTFIIFVAVAANM